VLGGLGQSFTKPKSPDVRRHLSGFSKPALSNTILHANSLNKDHLELSLSLSIMARFIYSPLDPAKKEIRLIGLLPGLFHTNIQVEIFHEKLSEPYQPDYEALSYVWGSTEDPEIISIAYRNELGGHARPARVGGSRATSVSESFSRDTDHPTYEILSVTQNLSTALRYLRRPGTKRVIWIDAICINQDNIQERSVEVARMGFIYTKARQVIVWLGSPTENSSLAIETIRSIGRDIRYDPKRHQLGVVDRSETFRIQHDADALVARVVEWRSIQDLLYRKWFTRLWIYQEIILSKMAVVVVGFSEVSWNTFLSVLYWTFRQPARIPSLSSIFDSDYNDSYVKPILRSTAVEIDIIDFVQFSRYASCSDPKDRIYSMLNLISLDIHRRNLGIIPDYSKTKEQVYYDFVQRYIMTLKNLRVLNLCDLRKSSPNLPSWIPNLSIFRYKAGINDVDASGRSEHFVHFSAAGKCLHLVGVAGGTINHVGQSIPDEAALSATIAICRTWEPSNLDEVYSGGGSMLDAFVKSLVCGEIKEDRLPNAGDVPTLEEGRNAILSFLRNDRIDSSNDKYGFLMRRMLRGRTLCTASNGLIGAFLSAAQIGDQICVALGSKTPLLLRPVPHQKDTYRLVGECYVAGLMNGEALLGSLPDLWKFGQVNKNRNRIYMHEGANSTLMDPRLGLLPDGWHIRYSGGTETNREENLNDFEFENKESGVVTWADPRLTKDALIERGSDMREFILV
jgi:hypothetical protein